MSNDMFALDFGTNEAHRQAMYAQQAVARQTSPYAGLGALGGGFFGGNLQGVTRQQDLSALIMPAEPRPATCGTIWGEPIREVAYIGKVKVKPGYIIERMHKNFGRVIALEVRVKVKTDYTWPERFVLWWNNVEFDKDGMFKV